MKNSINKQQTCLAGRQAAYGLLVVSCMLFVVSLFGCGQMGVSETQSASQGSGTSTGNITGQVRAGGSGLSGAIVAIVGTSTTKTTNATGEYTFTDVTAGVKTLQAIKTGYVTGSVTVEVIVGQTVTPETITLTANTAANDTTAPSSPNITINGGAASTGSTSVTLEVSATDNVGVTGYYVSEETTTPVVSASSWVSVTATTEYSATISFTLSSNNGTKEVSIWFKDGADNRSARVSASIRLAQVFTNIISIDAGDDHTIVLKNDGTVWAWGSNSQGQLGDGTTLDRSTPVQVSTITNVTAISAGLADSIALKNLGTVWAWGNNKNGQLGDGTTTDRYTPVQVPTF